MIMLSISLGGMKYGWQFSVHSIAKILKAPEHTLCPKNIDFNRITASLNWYSGRLSVLAKGVTMDPADPAL